MNTHPLPRGCAFARRLLGLGLAFCLGLAATATASTQVSREFTTGQIDAGHATKQTNHILTNPAQAPDDVIRFTAVDFGSGYNTLEIELSLGYGSGGQKIEARVGSSSGSAVATLYADATGNPGDGKYSAQTTTWDRNITGVHNLFITVQDTPGVGAIRLKKLTLKNREPLSTFLKRDGIHIRNDRGKGDIVRLYGVNLGGWAIHEPWMTPLQFRDTPTLEQDHVGAIKVLTYRFNSATVAANILNELYTHYITDEDFENMRQAGINCIRLPIYWADYMNADGTFKRLPNGRINFSRIESVVEKAKKRGMYVVIDLHGAQGSQNGHLHSGDQIDENQTPQFWTNTTYRENTRNLWREIARRFRSEPAVAGYDLLNEPAKGRNAHPWDNEIRDYVRTLYATIREVDPDHLVFFNVWSEYNHVGNLLNGYGSEDNLALSYHWYHFPAYAAGDESHFWANWINNSALSRTNHPFPVWIGEFSYKDDHNQNQWANRLKQMTRYGVSWTKWSYKVRYNPEAPNRRPGWGMYEAATTAGRLDLERDDQATLMQKARSWGTSAKFQENTHVTDAMTGAIALYGEPARPSLGGPIFGLTKDMPHTRHNGPSLGASGWGTFKPGGYVRIPSVDFGEAHDRFFAHAHVDATLGTGEADGILEIRLGGVSGKLIGDVKLESSGVTDALLKHRPVGIHDVFLVAKRPGGGTANIGLIKRVSFSEPPVVSLQNKQFPNFASVQGSGETLANTAAAAGDREDFFLLTTHADPIGAASFTTALLSRKTMKWITLGAGNVLQTGTAYNNAPGGSTIDAQRAAAPQFTVATTGDTTGGKNYRTLRAPNNLYLRVTGLGSPVKAEHDGVNLGAYEKFHLQHHNH